VIASAGEYGAEIQLRSELNDKIIEAVRKTGLTHGQITKLVRTSRSRITAILDRDTKGCFYTAITTRGGTNSARGAYNFIVPMPGIMR
jgi:predicted XRE-type DNA-binding protein